MNNEPNTSLKSLLSRAKSSLMKMSRDLWNSALIQKFVESVKRAYLSLAQWLEPRLAVAWAHFHKAVQNAFHLTDHSVIKTPRVIIRVGLVMFGLLFLWAAFFHIAQVVHAQGKVIAESQTQIIQSADGGVLVEIKVKEGEQVQEGQVLAIMEKSRAAASYTESYGKVSALKLTIARLEAIINDKALEIDPKIAQDFPDLAQTTTNLYKKQKKAYDEQVGALKESAKLAQEELEMNLPLERYGDISRADIIRLKRTANEAKASYANQRNKFMQDMSTDLNKNTEDLMTQEQILAQQEQLLEHTEIVASATGAIKNIRVTTLGGVLKPGDEILEILPTESNLVVEAKVKPADMANIRVGLPVTVKLDAYDYSIFGVLHGAVTYVSPDSLTEETKTGPSVYYKVKLQIDGSTFKDKKADEIEIRPGMTATVDIRTGNRSVLAIIFKPIVKTLSESFGEK